ncbi:MAG: XdhC family protein [Chthoniobacterales bacterium]
MFDEFLSKAGAAHSQGRPFAVATVVRHQSPVSSKAGDKAIIHADGSIWGWVGGGCVQPLVVREALKAIEERRSRLVRIAPSEGHEEGVVNYLMTCQGGGALDIFIEPVLPKPQILIVGRSLVARTLSKLGKAVGYTIAVIAPRGDRESFPDADFIHEELDFNQVKLAPETYVVVSTQGEGDEEALEQALRSSTPYVAFVASQAKARKILDALGGKGIPAELLGRVKAPAGLDFGTLSPEEIAVSILVEIIQLRKSKAALAGKAETLVASVAEARDPVCGMVIDAAGAKCTSEYGEEVFYFCCAGCKETFDQHPERYAHGK